MVKEAGDTPDDAQALGGARLAHLGISHDAVFGEIPARDKQASQTPAIRRDPEVGRGLAPYSSRKFEAPLLHELELLIPVGGGVLDGLGCTGTERQQAQGEQ